jgi:hypothetical protein
MPDSIDVDGKPYQHHSALKPADGEDSPLRDESEDRQSFFPDRDKMKLDNTAGAFVPLGDGRILLVIDKTSVPYRSPEWDLIAETAKRLEACYPSLSDQARAALANLRAVVFSAKPARSYADVRPDFFFYDTDEFRRSDASLVTPAWTASCIVHDANHIWQHDNDKAWHGEDAEVVCWQLQVDNAAALGLFDGEVDHLKKFIADPSKIIDRMNSNTFT